MLTTGIPLCSIWEHLLYHDTCILVWSVASIQAVTIFFAWASYGYLGYKIVALHRESLLLTAELSVTLDDSTLGCMNCGSNVEPQT